MTHEERARRYLEASRAASASERGSEAESIHHGTMRALEREHPLVREHALVGAGEDFDEPLNRNEIEHQRELRRQDGMTNTETAARRRQLRDVDYGRRARYSPSGIFENANPSHGRAQRRRSTSRRGGARRAARTVTSNAPSPVSSVGSIAWEFVIAGLALSLLYLVLRSEGGEGGFPVVSITANGIAGALKRLASPTNNLFGSAAATATTASSGGGGASGSALTGHVATNSTRSKPVPVTALGRRVTVRPTVTGQLH